MELRPSSINNPITSRPSSHHPEMNRPVREILDNINRPQERDENKTYLAKIGGALGLASKLGLSDDQLLEFKGLTARQVIDSRAQFGDNVFPESPMEGFLSIFFGAFTDTTLQILLASACVSLGIQTYQDPENGWIEGVAIFIAVFAVATISSTSDYSKELQFRALEKSTQKDEKTSVIRDGLKQLISTDDVVIGDILVLNTGDMIAADAVIYDSKTVLSNESVLTGEADDLKKSRDGDPFLLSSCLVKEAEECRALVIGTGVNSQWGKIKANLVKEDVNTPLQDKLEDMATLIGYVGLAAAAMIFTVSVIRIFTDNKDIADGFINSFILAVTIVVIAIPEGLPLAVAIGLAYSTNKMYDERINVRILAACETMGNATNICSDKTGTLTENRMTVVEGWFSGVKVREQDIKGTKLHPVVEKILIDQLCINRLAYLVYTDDKGLPLDRPIVVGNNTEGAFMLLAKLWGFNCDEVKKIAFNEQRDKLFAFNSDKKRSSVILHNQDGSVTLYTKGASEWLIKDCTKFLDTKGVEQPMSEEKREELIGIIDDMASRALRTLCLAHKTYKSPAELPPDWRDNPPDKSELCCNAVVGIMDPLRPDVIEAVAVAQKAGVVVRMVTGDNLATACAIARKCGILTDDGIAIEGPDFRAMSPADLDVILPKLQVLARSSPEDKYLLVTRLNGIGLPDGRDEWQEKYKRFPGVSWEKDRDRLLPGYKEEWEDTRPDGGHVVAVTGDGTNDAPALMAADVGLAMGKTGTKVAQSAADVIITDDNFSSIVQAILWGRSIYENIRKFLIYQLTINVVALIIVFIGAAAGTVLPLTAVQMLWVNLIQDTLAALALATEPPKQELMQRKPYKRNARLINMPMCRNILVQSIFQLGILLLLLFAGADIFGVHVGEWCQTYSSNSDSVYWNVVTDQQIAATQESLDIYNVTCADFKVYCPDGSGYCYEETHQFIENYSGQQQEVFFSFQDLDDFESSCLTCDQLDYTHGTLIFTTFIFCQVFNEFTSREIYGEWNVLKGVLQNKSFLGVIFFTVFMQILLVQFGGDFISCTPLDAGQWFACVGLAFVGFLLGIAMRWIPIEEDPESFFDSAKAFDDQRMFSTDKPRYGGSKKPKYTVLSPILEVKKRGALGESLLTAEYAFSS